MNGSEMQNLVLNSYHNSSYRVQEKNYVGDVVSTSDSQPWLLTSANKREETMDRIYDRSVLTNTETPTPTRTPVTTLMSAGNNLPPPWPPEPFRSTLHCCHSLPHSCCLEPRQCHTGSPPWRTSRWGDRWWILRIFLLHSVPEWTSGRAPPTQGHRIQGTESWNHWSGCPSLLL